MDRKLDTSVIVYGLSLFTGISYLWGFWITFDINILSYVALTDIIKASVYPALPAIGFLAIYSAMDSVNSMSKSKQDDYLAKGGVFKGYTYILKLYCYFTILFGLGSSAYVAIIETGYMRLLGLYPLASLTLFLFIILSNKFLMDIPLNIRVFIVSVFCFLPTYAFNKGFSNGEIARTHDLKGFYVVSKEYCSSSDTEKYRYIGVLGNRLFSISSKDNSICITKSENYKLVKYNSKSSAIKETSLITKTSS